MLLRLIKFKNLSFRRLLILFFLRYKLLKLLTLLNLLNYIELILKLKEIFLIRLKYLRII